MEHPERGDRSGTGLAARGRQIRRASVERAFVVETTVGVENRGARKRRSRSKGEKRLAKTRGKVCIVDVECRGDELAKLGDAEWRRPGVGGERHGRTRKQRRVGENYIDE